MGFATGYTTQEREMLVDEYMARFKEVFGYYPKSVGSWFIDAHTLSYMYDKYHIVASCNCKDQWGTDGYTMWGGYWNQAYYPSRLNAFMPAQTEEGQIPVPVFRMLGSDPVYQYDQGLGTDCQGVVTLEPVYTFSEGGGAVRDWVEWYLPMMADGECLAFNYVQAGQENSFTWERMKDGYELQMPIIRKLVDEGKLQLRTLAESGEWFKERFNVTPPTSVVAENDFLDSGKASIWYNSRYYRANLYWNADSFRFRDIHLFDENMESDYLRTASTSTKCVYTTLPVVDGYLWSSKDCLAGLRLANAEGEIKVGTPSVSKADDKTLWVKAETDAGELSVVLAEDYIEITLDAACDWSLELAVAPDVQLPFSSQSKPETLRAREHGFDYVVSLAKGSFQTSDSEGFVWRMQPDDAGAVRLVCR